VTDARLEALRTPVGRLLPPRAKAEIVRELERLEMVAVQLAEVEKERDAAVTSRAGGVALERFRNSRRCRCWKRSSAIWGRRSAEIAHHLRGERLPVGAVVAKGDAQIGFQQVSELLPVEGIDFLGPLPGDIQEITGCTLGRPLRTPPRRW
jgi:hypothetical protein